MGLLWGSLEPILGFIGKKSPQEHPPQADGSQVPRLRTKTDLLEFHADPDGPDGHPETVHELQFRPPVPHAPGIRMT